MTKSNAGHKPEVPATKNIDPRYPIHKCGMEWDFQANGLDKHAAAEQALGHSALIVRAQLAGQPIPVHARPGVQLLAVSIANHVIADGAQRLATYIGLDLDRIKKTAASDHISSC
ncbi:hypothetical protein IPJ70_00725 [Candidatus Campbellbacteria bacterium]|nr:MAG: hypothetical protein IPJ70_00725 [Candidatus Campbellbacteria bacterium]